MWHFTMCQHSSVYRSSSSTVQPYFPGLWTELAGILSERLCSYSSNSQISRRRAGVSKTTGQESEFWSHRGKMSRKVTLMCQQYSVACECIGFVGSCSARRRRRRRCRSHMLYKYNTTQRTYAPDSLSGVRTWAMFEGVLARTCDDTRFSNAGNA